jgi:dihydroorotate dehydrogenase
MLYKWLIRPVLFLFPAETAHHLAFFALGVARLIPGLLPFLRWVYGPHISHQVTIAGIKFPSRVGLAAGFDKDAKAVEALSALGFGFIEVGTVTPRPQKGNPKPRLFRLPSEKALINRMGFNNEGIDKMVQRLSALKNSGIIIGGNIGKNKDTTNENAIEDYLACLRSLNGLVDYFVVNISSPNTPGLRELQDKEPLRLLLEAVMSEIQSQEKQVPVFLKIAPDISEGQADDIIDLVLKAKLAGLIISNTTISREGLTLSKTDIESLGAGGLSGKPLFSKSTELLRYIKSKVSNSLVIIASGGIMSEQDAYEKIKAGADLVQLYTGFIYEGPSLIRRIRSLATS